MCVLLQTHTSALRYRHTDMKLLVIAMLLLAPAAALAQSLPDPKALMGGLGQMLSEAQEREANAKILNYELRAENASLKTQIEALRKEIDEMKKSSATVKGAP